MESKLSDKKMSGAENGWFSSGGFKNVDFSFSDFSVEGSTLKTKLHVEALKDASPAILPSEQIEPPYLQTVDYVVIAVLMSELYLTLGLKITQEELTKSWVKQLKMKEGKRSDRNSVQSVTVLRKGSIKLSVMQAETTFDVNIGRMNLQLTVAHQNAEERDFEKHCKAQGAGVFSYFLQQLDLNFYKIGYKLVNHRIQNIKTDGDLLVASGSVRQIVPMVKYSGIGSNYNRSMDMASFISISEQLAPALLCDPKHCNGSKPAGFRITNLEINYPTPMWIDHMKKYVKCKSIKEVQYQGQTWQIADVRASLGNIQAKFEIAYTLELVKEAEIEYQKKHMIA